MTPTDQKAECPQCGYSVMVMMLSDLVPVLEHVSDKIHNVGARKRVIEDQPPPVPNESTPIWELVIADMQERDNVGRARYGVPLQANNGRDPLIDAYQEALDLVVYLRQEIEERKNREPG